MPRGKTYSAVVGDPGRERPAAPGPRPSPARLRRLDAYLLRLVAGPLAAALGVTLTAFLLERALRLLGELAASNGQGAYMAGLLLTLAPHYLGLTLPAAFFLALFLVCARLGDGSEVDAMMAGGLSLDRMAAPFLVLGCGLGVVSLILSGWVQPEARYAYRSLLHDALTDGWNGRLQGGAFAAPDPKSVMTADAADGGGRALRGVWIRQRVDGDERVTTAARARLRPAPGDPRHVRLALEDGQQTRHDASGRPDVLAFRTLEIELPLPAADHALRARGEDERELTLGELARPPGGAQAGAGGPPRRKLRAELYARIAQALALPLLPLLAVPLSLSAKRGGRAASLVVAAAVLFGFLHLLQIGQGLGGRGRLPPLVGVGAPFAAFTGLSLWMWFGGRRRPGESPVSRAVSGLSAAASRLRLRPPRLGAAA